MAVDKVSGYTVFVLGEVNEPGQFTLGRYVDVVQGTHARRRHHPRMPAIAISACCAARTVERSPMSSTSAISSAVAAWSRISFFKAVMSSSYPRAGAAGFSHGSLNVRFASVWFVDVSFVNVSLVNASAHRARSPGRAGRAASGSFSLLPALTVSLLLVSVPSRSDVWVLEPSLGVDQRFDDNYRLDAVTQEQVSATAGGRVAGFEPRVADDHHARVAAGRWCTDHQRCP